AQLRITVAKAAREHPVILEMLADNRLHLSGIARLVPVLTAENREVLLARAVHKTKREIEEIVAELDPRPDVPSVIRKLPERAGAAPVRVQAAAAQDVASSPPPAEAPRPAPPPLPAFQPLSPSRHKIQFTADAELRDDLERLRALMRSQVPDGDLGAI